MEINLGNKPQELALDEIEAVNGGNWDWSDIAGSIGYNVGTAAGWYYSNVLVGDPWMFEYR